MKKIKWGIIGLGSTYPRFLKGLSLSEKGELYAVSSHTQAKVDEVSKAYPNVKLYSDYDALLEDTNIDAIYITLRHNDHFKWALKALQKGKAVLVEKPATIKLEDTQALVNASKEHNVMFIEALKTRFMPLNAKLHELLDNKIIGHVKSIEVGFGYNIPEDHARYLYDPEIGGIIYDVGSYTLGALLDFVKSPVKNYSIEKDLKKGVDAYERITLNFENGVTGIANNALDRNIDRNMTIIGDQGEIFVKDYHRASYIKISLNDGNVFEYNDPQDDFYFEIEAVHQGIKENRCEDTRMSHQDSIDLIKLILKLRKEILN